YTDPKYGFQFTYPPEWHVQGNILGSVQLFNSNRPDLGQTKGFAKGENKIESYIGTGTPAEAVSKITIDPTAEYPIKDFVNTQVKIAGQDSIRTETDLVNGQKIVTYR